MMKIIHKKPFFRGAALLVSFVIMLWILLSPLIPSADGERLTGLEYADQVFNELSKGSSNFMAQAKAEARTMQGKNVYLISTLTSEMQAELARSLLDSAGVPQLKVEGDKLAFRGDLGNILEAAVEDSEYLYNNDGASLAKKYGGSSALDISNTWWHLLNPCIQELQKEKKIEEAKVVDFVIRKAVEPGNNFYGIPDKKVSDNLLLLLGLLLFYICYTIWYGFGIYEIFDGLGFLGSEEKPE